MPIAPEALAPGRHVLLVVGLSLLLGLLVQGMRGLYRPDEGRYTAVAVGMLDTGDWIHPHLHPETPHFTKPPLTYWALATSLGAFGRNTFAARLPNTLAFFATLWLLGCAARRLLPRRPWLPVALYAVAAFPRVAAHVVTTDTLLTLFTTMAGCSFIAWRFDPQRPRRWLRLMYVGLGLGFATKGPPALLPLLPILGFTVLQDGLRGLRALGSWMGLALFLTLGLGWYAVILIEDPALVGRIVEREVVDRITSGVHRRNSDLGYVVRMYLPLLLLGTFPWFPFVWRGLGRAALALRRAGSAEARFLLAWVALPTLVLCMASSRLPLYVLQVFPPLVLLGAWAAPPTLLRRPRSALWLGALVLVGTLGLAAARWVPSDDDGRAVAEAIRAQVPFAPREVAFFHEPHMALAVYLGCTVEMLAIEHGADASGHAVESLEEELAQPEPDRLFCIDLHSEGAFTKRAAELGHPMDRLGATKRYAFYASPTRAADGP